MRAALVTVLRDLPATTAAPRFFDGDFFDRRKIRRGREFDAMIPPTLAVPSMARSGTPSHAEAQSRCELDVDNVILQVRPKRRRISAGVTPSALNSRRPVAAVDFDNFSPAAFRMRR